MPEAALLIASAQALGVTLDAVQAQRLMAYAALLDKWNRVHNLTALRDREKILTHHLLDSLAVLPWLTADRLLDVGSGGGLPGIPLAIARPELAVTLLDSNQKKTAFLRQAVIELGLPNVEVHAGRAEQFHASPAATLKTPQHYSGIIARAFAETAQLVALTQHLLAPQGRWYVMKGVYPHEELARLPVGAQLLSAHALQVPGLAAERHLLILGQAHD